MSWYNSHRHNFHFNLIHKAILVASLGMMTIADAASLGQVTVISKQHEPLSAIINVSGIIDADNFDANIANPALYQQLGLQKDINVNARFVKTSANAGQIILSSSEPVSAPFADVVLAINDNGEQQTKAQTLLMPLPTKNALKELSNPIMVANDNDTNLPVVQDLVVGSPLEVQPVTPPPLFDETALVNLDQFETTPINQSFDTIASTDTLVTDLPNSTAIENTFVNTSPSLNTQTFDDSQVISEEERVIASIKPDGINKQINILTEQIVRRVVPVDGSDTSPLIAIDPQIDPQQESTSNQLTPNQQIKEDRQSQSISTSQVDTSATAATYVVQSGDTLWHIANQIATANNLSVNTVMNELHTQNPDAFNRGNINQLRANATLSIPNYAVIPSQKAIEDAISVRKNTTKNQPNRPANRQARNTKKAVNPLPKTQVTLVSPSQSGQAVGNKSGSSNNSSTLIAALKDTRAQAAQKVRRVNNLNQELSSAAQKLQLQNQKLAELEARLKALKNK